MQVTSPSTEEKIWIALAELLFLDTSMDEDDFNYVAQLLKTNAWTREKTETTLIQFIAPVAGANVGYLIVPVIGEWSGFNEKKLIEEIRKQQKKRAALSPWRFAISDWWCRRMLTALGVQKLLDKI